MSYESIRQVMNHSKEIHEGIRLFYRRIAENTEFQEVKEVFASLAEKIEQDKIRLARSAAALKQL